jgi:hypothetical protein
MNKDNEENRINQYEDREVKIELGTLKETEATPLELSCYDLVNGKKL